MASKQDVPGNYHALYDRAARAARTAAAAGGVIDAGGPARAGVARMSASIPDLTVHLDEATRNPVQVTTAAAAGRISTRSAASPEVAARQFVIDRADLWQLDDRDLQTVDVVSVSATALPTVRMIQRVGGVEVFQSDMTAALAPDNSVVSVSGQPFHGAAGAPQRAADRAALAASEGTAQLAAEDAIAKAAADLTGYAYKPTDFKPARASPRRETGPYRYYDSKWKAVSASARAKKAKAAPAAKPAAPRFERPVRVKDVLFPLGEGEFVPGYYMELWIQGFPAFSYVVDSIDTPDILFRSNLTNDVAFTYRVHNTGDAIFRPEDGPAPGTPHPAGKPNGFQAATIPERDIKLQSLLPNRPWLAPNARTTRGNNCIAYADLTNTNAPGGTNVEGAITGPRAFLKRYDHSKSATTANNLQNSLVGMFFHVNWLHDRWYEAGFDEASGNAQQNNFGLGGLGGDPILAEGNDASGSDNANMATPADGASPRMQMFRFDGCNPLPSRTSNHEALITFHEMGHYISNRLVGNGTGLRRGQGAAMGEGWGDFFAICMTSQAADNFAKGVFAAGGWTDLTTNFKDNYYYSIRRYPYSADMSKNPLTFKHIGANVTLPAGPPRNPGVGGGNERSHNAGEVWCSALWEVFVNLVAARDHDTAEKRMLRYVIGGMKLTPPPNPTFLQARDGIVAAATALEPADVQLIWAGFAKRGMGRGAVAPPGSSTNLTGVVESFVK